MIAVDGIFTSRAESLSRRDGDDSRADAFRRGYERGLTYHQALMRKSRQAAGRGES